MQPLSGDERNRAFSSSKKAEVLRRQRLPVRYHVEDFDVKDRPQRFLQAFAAILKHTDYRVALDHYVRVTAKCAHCSVSCQVYDATGDTRDVHGDLGSGHADVRRTTLWCMQEFRFSSGRHSRPPLL